MEKIKPRQDDSIWVGLKKEINEVHNKNRFRLYESEWCCVKLPYIHVLIKLEYIKPIVVLTSSDYIQSGYYQRLKLIPKRLRWVKAIELAKATKKKLNRGKRPYTEWTIIVDHLNKNGLGPFNKYNELGRYSSSAYYNMLARLGYLERLDRKGNYNVLQKIPENLSSSVVNKMLYDKIYKRQVKILKLKEKLDSRDI